MNKICKTTFVTMTRYGEVDLDAICKFVNFVNYTVVNLVRAMINPCLATKAKFINDARRKTYHTKTLNKK